MRAAPPTKLLSYGRGACGPRWNYFFTQCPRSRGELHRVGGLLLINSLSTRGELRAWSLLRRQSSCSSPKISTPTTCFSAPHARSSCAEIVSNWSRKVATSASVWRALCRTLDGDGACELLCRLLDGDGEVESCECCTDVSRGRHGCDVGAPRTICEATGLPATLSESSSILPVSRE